jgi:hypothetical protein
MGQRRATIRQHERVHLVCKASPAQFPEWKTHEKRPQRNLRAFTFFVRSGKYFYLDAIALTRAVMRETLREPVFLWMTPLDTAFMTSDSAV